MYRFQRGLLRNLLEFEHGGPAEDGIEHIKIGILRGGSNQRNLAVFNVFQQGLLLLFVKGLNLIQVQQHTVGGHQRIQLAGDLPNVRCGGRSGVELIEGPVGLLGDDIGNGGFSRAAGTVENHIGNIPGFNQAAQYGPLSQNMLLAHHLIQGLRPQQVCQRLIHHMPPFSVKKGLPNISRPAGRFRTLPHPAPRAGRSFPRTAPSAWGPHRPCTGDGSPR